MISQPPFIERSLCSEGHVLQSSKRRKEEERKKKKCLVLPKVDLNPLLTSFIFHFSSQVGLLMFCRETNSVTARAGNASGTSEIITFGDKDPEATKNLTGLAYEHYHSVFEAYLGECATLYWAHSYEHCRSFALFQILVPDVQKRLQACGSIDQPR